MADAFVLALDPCLDSDAILAYRCVAEIRENRQVVKVDDLVNVVGIGKRRLQRLFFDYVGVSPKWVIQRYRLHEAVERLEQGEVSSLTELAISLNYFDQAHFIRDFERVVGATPSRYMDCDKGN